MPKTKKMEFDDWLQKVDDILIRNTGMSYRDLPDCPYADWHEQGVAPKSAAAKAVKRAKE